MSLVERIEQFIIDEARSCSMDMGCVTPLYVYRMWGGRYTIYEIEKAFKEIRVKVKNYNSLCC